MTRPIIIPYKRKSKGARVLAASLGGRVATVDATTHRNPLVINWGNAKEPTPSSALNGGDTLKGVTNKKRWFLSMKENAEVSSFLPPFWTNRADIPSDAYPVVCRTILTGHSGKGIVIANTEDELVDAKLYVKYIKKKYEYRIHVGKKKTGEYTIILMQRKARRKDHDDPNWQVRSHKNGFVFVRNEVKPPESVLKAAVEAVKASDLDFGAVDVIWNESSEAAYVLEINTAPGLEGSTISDYAKFFKERMDDEVCQGRM